MREKLLYALGAVAGVLLVRNMHEIFLVVPDEAAQGYIYRILFVHAPAAFVFMIFAFVSMVASVTFLIRRNFNWDSLAVSITEVALPFGAINLVTGMIWARIIWGVWWVWDARLTFMLISWLMYAGYLIFRRAIDEPTQRGRVSAVLSILTFPAVVVTWKAIEWWRTQHPGPVISFRSGGERRMDPGMESALLWNFIALLLFAAVLVAIRMRQESIRRELDGLRREAHAI
ncbi:MAG TPA: cytochrome c biogenesis protein CcsA [Bryobacteraceae bacterium]|nr:cytochrome c biogenesis protein CcsA [Bryobacteraceae bacterium]